MINSVITSFPKRSIPVRVGVRPPFNQTAISKLTELEMVSSIYRIYLILLFVTLLFRAKLGQKHFSVNRGKTFSLFFQYTRNLQNFSKILGGSCV